MASLAPHLARIADKPYDPSQNNTKRTSETFEGPADAEFVERALGDHDLDK